MYGLLLVACVLLMGYGIYHKVLMERRILFSVLMAVGAAMIVRLTYFALFIAKYGEKSEDVVITAILAKVRVVLWCFVLATLTIYWIDAVHGTFFSNEKTAIVVLGRLCDCGVNFHRKRRRTLGAFFPPLLKKGKERRKLKFQESSTVQSCEQKKGKRRNGEDQLQC